MGDRTSVTLTVLTEQSEEAETFFENFDHLAKDEQFSHYAFYKVNYGMLGFLDDLQKAGIAFSSNWDHGDVYGPGTDYLRFYADGSVWRQEISDSFINPELNQCMKLIDNPEELKEYIVQHFNAVTPPSWDHQIEYGRLHKTIRLIQN